MKATIRKDSPRYADWIRVFGDKPVPIEPIPGNRSRYRVRIAELKILQRQRCAKYVAETAHLPIDQAVRIAPHVDAKDVEVVEELFS